MSGLDGGVAAAPMEVDGQGGQPVGQGAPAGGPPAGAVVQEQDLGSSFMRIEKLQDAGINVADVMKLKAAGYGTTQAIVGCMKKDLLQIKGLAEQKVDKIVEAAQKLAFQKSFFSAEEMLVKLDNHRFKISTGASCLDAVLRGGVESGQITELYGEFRSGKTQICHALSIGAQMHETSPGRVLYIDTENTFRPDRIQEIAKGQGLEDQIQEVMKSEHLLRLLMEASVLMVDEDSPFALIVIDSIMGVFRTDYSGRGELAERQQALGKVLSRLQKISEEFNCAVVLTNQVMADPAPMGAAFGNAPKPVGGHVLAHASTTRLYCRKGKGDERIIKVVDSPCLPESEATVQIYYGGIKNPDGL